MSVKKSSAPPSSERFTARRRRRRLRTLIGLGVFLALLSGAIIWGLHQSAVRISHVVVYGADPSLAEYATSAMQGSYLGIIPRDSSFFRPEESIRADILTAHPEIAAVSVFSDGLTNLSIKVDNRVGVARWCGLAPTEGVDAYCYVFDANGRIFTVASTSVQTINSSILYAPLEGGVLEPLRANIAHAEKLPRTFDFARQLASFGSTVSFIVIHDGEVDQHLANGTRVTYVLGDEQNAYTALVSARSNFNLADGSLNYVDLRFDGKVYTKKK